MNRLLTIFILTVTSFNTTADEYWKDSVCFGKCEYSTKFITSHKPNYSGNIKLDISVAYRNVRQGIYECFSIRDRASVSIFSDYYHDIELAEIFVTYAENPNRNTLLYVKIKQENDGSSTISAWGNIIDDDLQYAAKHINDIAEQGIDVDCEKIFELEERKKEHDKQFKKPL